MTVADFVNPSNIEVRNATSQLRVRFGFLERRLQNNPIGIARRANETRLPKVHTIHISGREPSKVASELPRLSRAAIASDVGSRNVGPPIACQLSLASELALT
jgi:hypothetical protein